MTDALGEFVFATDERTLPEVVLDLLRERGWTAATAESCTGGMVAARLTDVPGSSEAFAGGVVVYSDELKRALLGVPADVLAAHGAVSAETAQAMAAGARERLGADVAVSVTGIAGPGRRHAGEAGGARVPARVVAGGRGEPHDGGARRPRDRARTGRRGRAAAAARACRCSLCTRPALNRVRPRL